MLEDWTSAECITHHIVGYSKMLFLLHVMAFLYLKRKKRQNFDLFLHMLKFESSWMWIGQVIRLQNDIYFS